MTSDGTYYLVETFIPGRDYSDGEVIALTPGASQDLDRARIAHRVINEFFSDEELRSGTDRYFFDQIGWFRQFDAFLKNNISYCNERNINLATAHYNPLKYLIDSCVTYSFILKSFFKSEAPVNIKMVAGYPPENIDHSLYNIFHPQSSFYAQLLKFFCRERGVRLEYITDASPSTSLSAQEKLTLISSLKKLLIKLNIKSLQSYLKYKKYLLFGPHKKNLDSTSILFLHTGSYPIDRVVERALRAGARVFTMSKDCIFHEGALTQSIALDFSKPADNSFIAPIQAECAKASTRLKEEPGILAWIDDKCQCNVTEMLIPYFDNFINQICVEDIAKINMLRDFYSKKNIDLIVVRSSSGRDSAFSLAAAGNRIKKACYQHSCTAFEQLSLLMTDTYFFDYYVTTDPLSEKYFKIRTDNELFGHCEIVQSPHYLSSLGTARAKIDNFAKREKEIIMYAPCDIVTGRYNLNIPMYELNWYCKFLKELLDHLCRRQDKIFIFKYRAGVNWAEKVIAPYIRTRNFTNIRVESGPFNSYLDRVDRMILDYPSTGFFESVAAGLPTMSLYQSSQVIWDYAADFFGPMLQPFKGSEDAIASIDSFLAGDRKRYIAELPLAQNSIVDILRHMKGSRRSL